MLTVIDHDHNGTIHSVTVFPNNPVGKKAALDFGKTLIREYYQTADRKEPSIHSEEAGLEIFDKSGEWKDFSSGVTLCETRVGEISGNAQIQHESDDEVTYVTQDPEGTATTQTLEVGPQDIVFGVGISAQDRLELGEIAQAVLNSQQAF